MNKHSLVEIGKCPKCDGIKYSVLVNYLNGNAGLRETLNKDMEDSSLNVEIVTLEEHNEMYWCKCITL